MLYDKDHSWVQTAKVDVTKPDNIPHKITVPLNTTIHSSEMRAETQKEGEGLDRLRTGK